jgi:hypothetical protein
MKKRMAVEKCNSQSSLCFHDSNGYSAKNRGSGRWKEGADRQD